MSDSASRQELLEELRSKLRAAKIPSSISEGAEDAAALSLAAKPFDAILPSGYRDNGTLIEWLADGGGHGALWLAFKLAAESLPPGGVLVAVDSLREFYPPVATSLGIPLDRLILLRPHSQADALWGLEQSLRCPGVAAVVCRVGKLDPRAYRRLQLAVESGGGVGMLIRPAQCGKEPCWADVRLQVRASSAVLDGSAPDGRRLQIEVLRRRVGTSGAMIELEVSDETGCVRLVPQLATSTTVRRATGT